jgi:hypothetical protein
MFDCGKSACVALWIGRYTGNAAGVGPWLLSKFSAKCLRISELAKLTSNHYHDEAAGKMGVQKKTRKFRVKRIIGQRDARLKKNQLTGEEKPKSKGDDVVREM